MTSSDKNLAQPVAVIGCGEVLEDWIPSGDGLEHRPGGAPLNMTAESARFGLNVSLLCCVGPDESSQKMIKTIAQQGVATDLVFEDPESVLCHTEVQVDPQTGERKFVFFKEKASFAALSKEMVEKVRFPKAGWFHCGTVCLLSEKTIEAQEKAVTLAKENGLIVTFDPNFRPSLFAPGVQEELARRFAVYADVIKVGEDEVPLICSTGKVADLFKMCPDLKLVILTKGKDGMSAVYRDGSSISIDGVKPRQISDTVGCGDVSFGAFVGRLGQLGIDTPEKLVEADKETIRSALAYAAVAGSLQCERKGGLPTPTLEEIDELASLRGVDLEVRK